MDDYPGAAGYVLGYCTDSQLYEGRIRSFPKERWALLGKVARDLFEDGLDTRNWDRFTKILAPSTYSITRWHHHDFGVRLSQVFNLAAQTRCPESIDVGYLYQEARWIEGMLAEFIIIEDLDPPERRRHKDAVRPLARRNLSKIVSAVFAETAARQVPEGENREPAVQVTSRHWRGPSRTTGCGASLSGNRVGRPRTSGVDPGNRCRFVLETGPESPGWVGHPRNGRHNEERRRHPPQEEPGTLNR